MLNVNLHLLGGCGLNAGKAVKEIVDAMSFRDAKISYAYANTSMNDNREPLAEDIKFFHIPSENQGGGGRRSNTALISASSVVEYMSFLKLPNASGEVDIMLFSTSGSTGSMFAQALLKKFDKRTVVLIGVYDTGSCLNSVFTENSLKCINNLVAISSDREKTNASLTLFDNDSLGDISPRVRDIKINEKIAKLVKDLLTPLTESVIAIDNEDYLSFLTPLVNEPLSIVNDGRSHNNLVSCLNLLGTDDKYVTISAFSCKIGEINDLSMNISTMINGHDELLDKLHTISKTQKEHINTKIVKNKRVLMDD